MIQQICHKIIFRWMGWHSNVSIPQRKKCIICVAPHTSNYDFIIGQLYYKAIGEHANFLMKKEWFFWPLGYLFKALGGIPVERSRHQHMTDAIAETAMKNEYFRLAITPEGTRSKVENWKKGFYFIALKAQIPIQFYALDYEKKCISCTMEIIPKEENFKQDMQTIMNYYKDVKAKHPAQFQTEKIK